VAARDEYQPLLREIQTKNRDRVDRLHTLLEREQASRLEAIEAQRAQAPAAPAEDGEVDPVAQEVERFALAEQLRLRAADQMDQVTIALAAEHTGADWARVAETAGLAVESLDALRSLFFSIVEHVRALAEDQLDLTDRTREAIALAATEQDGDEDERGPETRARGDALAGEQQALGGRGGALADVLIGQAEAIAEGGAAPAQPGVDPSAGSEAAEDPAARMRRAAEHVAAAQLAMGDAETTLRATSGPLLPAEEAQTLALESLREALELLSPSPPPEQGDSSEQQQEQQPSPQDSESEQSESPDSGRDAEAEASDDSEAQPQDGDPSQLLQGVRDREAERRRARERDRERLRSQPVEKDW
jgi:hypothetical protein